MSRYKLIAGSDFHKHHGLLDVPSCDVFVIAGDIFKGLGSADELIEFARWLRTLNAGVVILVPGNHELFIQKFPVMAENILKQYAPNAILLIDRQATVAGELKIYGCPWTIASEANRFAYSIREGYSLKPFLQDIGDPHVLVSHQTPFGYNDLNAYGVHAGSRDLLDTIMNTESIALSLSGHNHESWGQKEENGKLLANVAVCGTGAMEPKRPLSQFDILMKDGRACARYVA